MDNHFHYLSYYLHWTTNNYVFLGPQIFVKFFVSQPTSCTSWINMAADATVSLKIIENLCISKLVKDLLYQEEIWTQLSLPKWTSYGFWKSLFCILTIKVYKHAVRNENGQARGSSISLWLGCSLSRGKSSFLLQGLLCILFKQIECKNHKRHLI